MKDKNLKKEKEFKPGKFDPEQVVGDQNSVSGKVVETEKLVSENTENESEARRTSRILNDAEKTREKLNSKLNDVRDYGADARETTL
ncbi:MAG: hypothetical protein LBU84_17090 [Prevotella sp.]|jgi:hypothetical protein|nr:hypothetical protein [Prevotella sp.]